MYIGNTLSDYFDAMSCAKFTNFNFIAVSKFIGKCI